MRSIIILIRFVVGVLLVIVPTGARAESITEILGRMSQNGETIDGIFKPSINGSLGSGWFGTTWKGQLSPCDNMEVAMKFSQFESFDTTKIEYATYSHLNAINNSDVRKYGIPTVHYYGPWKNFKLMALTLRDSNYQQRVQNGDIRATDLLIACREFVRIIKYIHSRGIIHNDCKIQNIIIQNGQGFIYDFSLSMDMNEFNLTENIGHAKEDFKRFLYSLFTLVEPKQNWHWLGFDHENANRMRHNIGFVNDLANDARTNKGKPFSGLRRVLVEFAKHACDKDSASIRDFTGIPFYDELYQVICNEMKVSGSIASIPDPFGLVNWTRAPVKYELFEIEYADRIRNARENSKTTNKVDKKSSKTKKGRETCGRKIPSTFQPRLVQSTTYTIHT